MLTDGIAAAYRDGRDRVAAASGVQEVLTSVCDLRNATPYLYETTGDAWLADETLGEEVFGPLGLIVRTTGADQMETLARALHGQLTVTLHLDADDAPLAARLLPALERKAGRILANGFPTGVEVADSMVHGGPYPASTNFGHTSVGTLAIRRFLRPVCYQNMPEALLPAGNNCLVICLTAINDDTIRAAMSRKCLSNEALCSRQVTVFAEEELDRVTHTVDGTVEIHPLAAHLDVSFVDVPLASDGTLALVETLQQLRREVNDPAVHGRMIDAQAPFGHHLFEITQAEIVGEVPAYAQQDH
jgi:acyl-CoA reductase-like NAD-dependent aldehyde dehydrogenase